METGCYAYLLWWCKWNVIHNHSFFWPTDLEDGPFVGGMAEGRTARNGIDDDDAMETGQFDDAD